MKCFNTYENKYADISELKRADTNVLAVKTD